MGRLDDAMARGTVSVSDGEKKMRSLQARFLADEVRDDLEHFEPYGFSSEPHEDAEVFALFPCGDRSHGVVICVADRRFRLRPLKAGEVAIFDDLGQKVHLTREGIDVSTPGWLHAIVGGDAVATVTGSATLKAASVTIDSPSTTITGDVRIEKSLNVVGKIMGTGGMAVSGGSGATVDGSLVTTGDVVAAGISLDNHVHPGDSGGMTGKPQ